MTAKIAIVGSGIAGLSAAYHLPRSVEVTVYDKSDHVGGHANTVEVEDGGRTLGIDTAFVVYNARTYPQLSQFFADLAVPTCNHTGGFNFFDLDTSMDYGTAELDLSEDEVAIRYAEDFQLIWADAKRFHREAPRDFLRKRTDLPLGEYLDANGYSHAFKHSYVVLLATAVWSVPADLIWTMPATTVIAFYMSHDEGALGGRSIAWKTVGGGSISYVRRVVAALTNATFRTGTAVTEVARAGRGVEVHLEDGGVQTFDHVIMAAHADETLRLLADPSPEHRSLLEGVRYSSTTAILHTDPAVMPPDRDRWQSWNYGKTTLDGSVRTWVAYYMNQLQGFTSDTDYFVTLDCPIEPHPYSVIRRLPYTHPIIDMHVRRMQKGIQSLNTDSQITLAGSYFHSPKIGYDLIGSHEAAFASGQIAAHNATAAVAPAQRSA